MVGHIGRSPIASKLCQAVNIRTNAPSTPIQGQTNVAQPLRLKGTWRNQQHGLAADRDTDTGNEAEAKTVLMNLSSRSASSIFSIALHILEL